jgi:hypothetical protein
MLQVFIGNKIPQISVNKKDCLLTVLFFGSDMNACTIYITHK